MAKTLRAGIAARSQIPEMEMVGQTGAPSNPI
jgi:hypothetical protein